MSSTRPLHFPALERPPIEEVVCGLVFDDYDWYADADLDVVISEYRQSQATDAERAIQEAEAAGRSVSGRQRDELAKHWQTVQTAQAAQEPCRRERERRNK